MIFKKKLSITLNFKMYEMKKIEKNIRNMNQIQINIEKIPVYENISFCI